MKHENSKRHTVKFITRKDIYSANTPRCTAARMQWYRFAALCGSGGRGYQIEITTRDSQAPCLCKGVGD